MIAGTTKRRLLAFDALTVPDVAGIRRLHHLPDELGIDEVAEYALQRCRVNTGRDQLPCHLRQIVCIGGVEYCNGAISHFSFGAADMVESLVLQAFFDRVGTGASIWSWQGRAEFLPVLTARALVLGAFMQEGAFESHSDLARDLVLPSTPLAEYATVAGLPLVAEPRWQDIWLAYQAGNLSYLSETVSSRAGTIFVLGLRLAATHGRIGVEMSREISCEIQAELGEPGSCGR